MAVEGTLDLFRLPEILQLISQQGKTGILTVQGQQDIVAVSFLNGRIVAADALTQTVEEGLAQVLVSEELVSAGDFSRVAAENQAAGGRLLDALVERGLVTRAKLLAALRVQTQRQLQRLLRWDQGDFKFYTGDEVSYEDGFLPISVEDLLLESLQDFADRPLRPTPPLPTPPLPGFPAASPAGAPAPAAARSAPAPPPARPPLPAAGVPDLPELPVTKVFPAPPASQVFPLAGPALAPPPRTAAAAGAEGGSGEEAGARRRGAGRPLRVVPIRPDPHRAAGAPAAAGVDAGRPRALPVEAPLTPPAPEPPLPKKFRKMELARAQEGLPGVELAAAALLAALLAGGVIASLVLRPAVLTYPLPWQAAARANLVRQQQQALYLKIDRGAKTFFLLEGRFPDRLQQLAEMGLLSPGDFEDAERRPLRYSVREESYSLRPLAGGKPVAELETTESVGGNFLLDPQLLLPVPTAAPPIVLLD